MEAENETTLPSVKQSSDIATSNISTDLLKKESIELINKIIAETDTDKTKDLTYLFNQNQNKKTIVRMDKYNELLDLLTDQMMTRAANRPDEITTKEIIDSIKTVNDLIDRGQKQILAEPEQPLIQINSQTNELNVGSKVDLPSRDSRERVKNAVLSMLQGLNLNGINVATPTNTENTSDLNNLDKLAANLEDEDGNS